MNRKLGIAIIVSFIFQYIYYDNLNILEGFQFLNGVPRTDSFSKEAVYLMGWYFPIFFILLYFSGYLKNKFVSQGIPFIIRDSSKLILILKGSFKVYIFTLLFVFIQTVIYLIDFSNKDFKFQSFILLIIMYYLFLICSIFLQSYFELFIPNEISFIVVNIIILISISNSKLNTDFKFLEYLNISSTSMGFRNGLIENTNYINPILFIVIAILIILFVQTISLFKVKKMDIL